MTLRQGWQRLTAFFDHPDARLALGGTVALIVVGNQPFYPFYVWYAAGQIVPSAFLTWLSMPAFAVAPALARRVPSAGRALLLAAAFGNTALSARALGPSSAVELFYAPSLLLAVVTTAPGSRLGALTACGAALACGLALARFTGPPWATLSGPQAHALATMHGISVGGLLAVMGFQAWRLPKVSRTGS